MQKQREGLLAKYSRILQERNEEMRRENPLAFGTRDRDVLIVEEVAAILRCSVDHVRRINQNDLPKHAGAGKQNLYLRHEVVSYVERLGPKNFNNNSLSYRVRSTNKVPTTNVVSFDADGALDRLKELKDG